MNDFSVSSTFTVQRLKRYSLVVLLALLLPLTALASARSNSSRVQPALLTLVQQRPNTTVSVIIQKQRQETDVEQVVIGLGGVVTKQLRMINAFAADVPANTVPEIARADGVRWVSLDAPMLDNTCTGCVSTSAATSAWLQTTMAKKLWETKPELQGQDITVAVLDSGMVAHPDLQTSSGMRTVGAAGFVQTRSVRNTIEFKNYTTTNVNGDVGALDHSEWVQYNKIDFGTGVASFEAFVAAPASHAGQVIEIRLDSPTGQLIGSLRVQATGSWNTFKLQRTDVSSITGVRDVVLLGRNPGLATNIEWFRFSSQSVAQAIVRNAQEKVEAEAFDMMYGATNWGGGISNFDSSDWIQYNNINFGSGVTHFLANVSVDDANAGGQIEVRLDDPNGPLLGTLTVKGTGGYNTYVTQSIPVNNVTGQRSVVLVGKGRSSIANLLWFRFSNAADEYGHGTHVAGIIGGNGNKSSGAHIGIAPRVKLVNVRVNDRQGAGTTADVIAGLQWINDNRVQYNIKVVNISLNSRVQESYHQSALNAAVEILWFNGITVVVSAGNNGADGKIYPPANDPFVISVGATNDKGTANRGDDVIASFSARGATEDGFTKPELVAPGVDIVSLNCPSCIMNLANSSKVMSGFTGAEHYFKASGTSMSAAVVSGAAALLLQSDPTLTPDQVKARLMETGYHQAFGDMPRYLNIDAAVKSTLKNNKNTNIESSKALWTGSDKPVWDSVKWGSVKWGSVKWGSVNWNSAAMASSAINSTTNSVYFGK